MYEVADRDRLRILQIPLDQLKSYAAASPMPKCNCAVKWFKWQQSMLPLCNKERMFVTRV